MFHIRVCEPHRVWLHWMFYDHLSAHSLLAKLGRWGWLMRMRLVWKESHKPLNTSKRLHINKTRSTGSAGKGTWSQLLLSSQLRTRKSAGASSLRAPRGVWHSWPGGSYNRVLNCGSPKRVGSLLHSMIDFGILVPRARQRGGGGGATVLCPLKWNEIMVFYASFVHIV